MFIYYVIDTDLYSLSAFLFVYLEMWFRCSGIKPFLSTWDGGERNGTRLWPGQCNWVTHTVKHHLN